VSSPTTHTSPLTTATYSPLLGSVIFHPNRTPCDHDGAVLCFKCMIRPSIRPASSAACRWAGAGSAAGASLDSEEALAESRSSQAPQPLLERSSDSALNHFYFSTLCHQADSRGGVLSFCGSDDVAAADAARWGRADLNRWMGRVPDQAFTRARPGRPVAVRALGGPWNILRIPPILLSFEGLFHYFPQQAFSRVKIHHTPSHPSHKYRLDNDTH
jgi:hypothetical protein